MEKHNLFGNIPDDKKDRIAIICLLDQGCSYFAHLHHAARDTPSSFSPCFQVLCWLNRANGGEEKTVLDK